MGNRAICVGINDYPGTNMDLAGCVNDAKDWQALLERRGYRVDALHNREATRARIVDALRTAIRQTAEDKAFVFTFSGHGSWLPDDDRDEPDARDEMICPYDVMKEQYLLDDELHDIFCTKHAGARIYVMADSCHSGSVARYASAPAQPDSAPLKARSSPKQDVRPGGRRTPGRVPFDFWSSRRRSRAMRGNWQARAVSRVSTSPNVLGDCSNACPASSIRQTTRSA
jgi:hypothetical protein